MKKFLIKAYADPIRGLKEQTKTISANDYGEAYAFSWKMFPEYKEMMITEERE